MSIHESQRFLKKEAEDEEMKEEDNMATIAISGVMIKHDFDHVIVADDADEVMRSTAGDLACS